MATKKSKGKLSGGSGDPNRGSDLGGGGAAKKPTPGKKKKT